jgi:4-methyl-5(b-hydroxyethyl)-thiazole monophosphate biosynthesis
MSSKRVLVLFAQGFEEIETVTVIDVLRRAGLEVTTASASPQPVQGGHGIGVAADRDLDGLDPGVYDALVLPGGMENARTLAADDRYQSLIRRAHEKGLLLGAICAAPVALEAAALLTGRTFTSHPSVEAELPAAGYRTDRVVRDGDLVTSRGPGTALEFALALVARLLGPSRSDEVAAPMLAAPR